MGPGHLSAGRGRPPGPTACCINKVLLAHGPAQPWLPLSHIGVEQLWRKPAYEVENIYALGGGGEACRPTHVREGVALQ